MEKIGILGGTFNPVHLEHINLAKKAVKALNLDKLIIMPTYLPPHKEIIPAPAQDRLNMLKLAFLDDDKIEVSDFEIEKQGKSYTYLTVEHFKEKLSAHLYFIVGGDMLTDFKTWRNPDRILKACDLCVFGRDDFFTDYQAETASLDHDIRIVKQGLANLYVEKAEKELAQAEVHLASLQKELLLLKEELKYYKITAPFDGYCVIESDTVGSYNSAGTAAAYVHKDDRKRIYAYFKEEDIHRIYEGMKCRVISNQYGPEKIFEAQIYAIKRYRYEYGAGVYFEVRFNLTGEPQPLRIDSNVIIEIPKQ